MRKLVAFLGGLAPDILSQSITAGNSTIIADTTIDLLEHLLLRATLPFSHRALLRETFKYMFQFFN
jgi:hypothetical protein